MPQPLLMMVDDDADALQMWSEFFEMEGLDVCGTSSALHAIELAVTRRPDVILTDLSMPHVDGWTILTTLKQHPLTAAIPIAVMTGRDDERNREQAVQRGCDAFLVKPCQPAKVADTLRSLLAARKATCARTQLMASSSDAVSSRGVTSFA